MIQPRSFPPATVHIGQRNIGQHFFRVMLRLLDRGQCLHAPDLPNLPKQPYPPSMAPAVLIVDDEDDILDLLAYNLKRAKMTPLRAGNGLKALKVAQQQRVDLIILDVMMPQLDGLETCRRLRRDPKLRHIPILILTARSAEEDHIAGLDVGADSFLPKSAGVGVIISQVRAILRAVHRQSPGGPSSILTAKDLRIDQACYLVHKGEGENRVEIRLPRKEFELLHFLASAPGVVYRRTDILTQIWGDDVLVSDRTVDVHVRKIRKKLGKKYIETVKGVGYRFRDPAD